MELKTGAKRFTDDQIDLGLQRTLYSYALRQMGYQTDGEETLVGYDQLLKLKIPDIETYFAVRGNVHYAWAYNLVRKVLKAVNNEIAGSWQIKEINHYAANHWMAITQPVGFIVALSD